MAIKFQTVSVKPRKGFPAAMSRENQRAWSEKAWSAALAKGNFDRAREHLNFEIVGGRIQAVDKSKSIAQKLADNLAARGIKDPNASLDEPYYRTIGDLVFSGNHDRMVELAFGGQEVTIKPGNNVENLNVKRMPDVEQWAMDIYNFCCGKYGEENIISFIAHLDETSVHIHAAIVPVVDNKVDYGAVFGGKTRAEGPKLFLQLHDEVAEVNRKWGLERGTSLTDKKARGKQTFEYRRDLERQSREKEAELEDTKSQLSAAQDELKLAQTRVKGLTSMISNLESKKEKLGKELAELQRKMKVDEGDHAALQKLIDEKEAAIADVEASLADKNAKLAKAEIELEDAKAALQQTQDSTSVLQEKANSLSSSIRSVSGIKVKEAMLDKVISDYKQLKASLPPEQLAAFDGSFLNLLAERGNEMLHCGVLLFAGLVNDATTFAEGHGGGGGGSDLKWGRDDDEDDRRWARRCVAMANHMMRPASNSRRR